MPLCTAVLDYLSVICDCRQPTNNK